MKKLLTATITDFGDLPMASDGTKNKEDYGNEHQQPGWSDNRNAQP